MKVIQQISLIFSLLVATTASAQLLDSIALNRAYEFRSIEDAIAFGNPDSVFKLNLKGKRYKSLPTEIFQFVNLQELNLKRNKLKNLGADIAKLKNLQRLDISKNSIESLPKEIGELNHLHTLNISQNYISSFPKEFAQLQKLKFLDMWSNEIDEFPEEMSQMKNLIWIDMRTINMGNEKQDAIQEILPHAKIYFSPGCDCGN